MVVKLLINSIFGNKQQRYDAIHTILSIISIRLGFRLGNRNLYWLDDHDVNDIYVAMAKNDNKKNRITERKYILYSIAKSVSNVEGDIVECGVFRGHSSYLMLYANFDNNKMLFGFDSFEGLSEPEKVDRVKYDFSYKWEKNDLSVSERIAEKKLKTLQRKI